LSGFIRLMDFGSKKYPKIRVIDPADGVKSNPMDKEVAKIYGDKVRVRACGICWEADRLLMVNHSSITPTNFWAPPGGGVEFGESIGDTLTKEFAEETGLKIKPGDFLFGCEFIKRPIHSIELFYSVTVHDGKLKTGHDPEMIRKYKSFVTFVF
jgi:8-oxo-dGTP diphosphatase